jgi:hypothetical protein
MGSRPLVNWHRARGSDCLPCLPELIPLAQAAIPDVLLPGPSHTQCCEIKANNLSRALTISTAVTALSIRQANVRLSQSRHFDRAPITSDPVRDQTILSRLACLKAPIPD